MKTELAITKKSFRIHIDWWAIVVLLDKAPNRAELISDKIVTVIDWKTINFSYVKRVEEFEISEDIPGTAMARAKTLSNWYKQVMIERITTYEQHWDKMSLEKAKARYKYFDKIKWKWETDRYDKIFISNWWSI